MKKFAIAFVLLFSLVGASGAWTSGAGAKAAPELAAGLKDSLGKYSKATIARDVEGMVSMLYPAIFKVMPRKALVKILTDIYSDPKVPVVKAIDYNDIGEIIPYANGHYAFVGYVTSVEMIRPTDSDKSMDEAIIKSVKKRMGADTTVTIDKQNSTVLIGQKAVLLAIREKDKGWKIVGKDSLKVLNRKKLLPADIAAKVELMLGSAAAASSPTAAGSASRTGGATAAGSATAAGEAKDGGAEQGDKTK